MYLVSDMNCVLRKVMTVWLLLAASCILSYAQMPIMGTPDAGSSRGRPSRGGARSETSGTTGTTKQLAVRFKTLRIDDMLGEHIPTDIDTANLNFQNTALPERKSTVAASYLANLGSPFQSMVYADRRAEERFLFMQPYDQWKDANDEWVWVNVTRPYTNGTYFTTVGNDYSQEEDFRFYFSANMNKNWNIGADYESILSRGYYTSLATRDKVVHLFTNYQTPRYELFARGSYHRFENYENGGIINDDYITRPLEMSGGYREYESLNIPVSLANTFNLTVYRDLFLNHKYHLGFMREQIVDEDTSEVFVPVTSLIHTFQLDQGRKNYDSRTANQSYYSQAYIDGTHTADSAALLTMRNVLGLSLREGFHSWAKFGLTAYAMHEYRRYATLSSEALPDSSELDPFRQAVLHHENLLWAGGRLTSTQDSIFQFDADARLCLLGNIGDFDINGRLKSHFRLWKQLVGVEANARVTNSRPDYFLRHFHSNHYTWTNSLDNIYKVRLEGRLQIPSLGTDLKVGVENVSNYVYFNTLAKPQQFDGQLQVLYTEWKQHLGYKLINFDFDVVGQVSSNESVLPLPRVAAYADLYIKTMFSKVMTAHIGVDCRYYTSYYIPAYSPALGMYHLQTEKRVGDYPFMNAYANFHLKRARFFIMYIHGSRWFAEPNYFNVLHYPLNPASVKAGISWNFYD